MTVRDVLARVLREAGSGPVQTGMTPSGVVERARRGRRAALAWRAASAAGAGAVVVAAVVVGPGLVQRQGPPGTAVVSQSSPGTSHHHSRETAAPVPMMQNGDPTRTETASPRGRTRGTTASEPGSVPQQEASASTSSRSSHDAMEMPSWGARPETGAGDVSAHEAARLTGIRIGTHATFDRVVFDFAGGTLPAYRVRYVGADGLRAPGSGRPVSLPGGDALEVTFRKLGHAELDGPNHPGGEPPVLAARYLGGFEQVHTAGIGIRGDGGDHPAFRVLTLHGPARVVVDVARAP